MHININTNKEDTYSAIALLVFLIIFQILTIIALSWLGLLMTLILGIPTYMLYMSLYRRLKYPIVQIYDDYINYSYGGIKVYYEDIKTIEINKLNTLSIELTLKNEDKYKDTKFKHPLFEKEKISFILFLVDFDIELLEKELKKKINDLTSNIVENLDVKKDTEFYIANEVGLGTRLLSIFGIIFLTIYSFYSIAHNKIVVPGKGRAIELTDISMYIMVVAVFFFIIRILLIVIDHYDKRNNEKSYENAKIIVSTIGYIFFFLALIYSLTNKYHIF